MEEEERSPSGPLRSRSVISLIAAGAITLASGVGCYADLSSPGSDRGNGSLGDGDRSVAGDGDGTVGGDGDGAIGGDGDVGDDVCAPRIARDLVLLGELAYVNSLRDLLGVGVLEGRLAPEAQTKAFSQKGLVANTSLVSTRLDWAEHASAQIDGRVQEVTGCTTLDEACARGYLESFSHRAYRRRVLPEEIDDVMIVFQQGATSSFEDGIKLAVQALLISPSFNHRTEYGVANADGIYELTPHEKASAISFLLTDSLPDEQLLAAADSGTLQSEDIVTSEVERLLDDPSVQDSVEKTLLAAWTLGNLFGKVKEPSIYPEFSSLLASQMYRETELFLKHHLWDPSLGIGSVLSSRTSFINSALAQLYEVPFPGADPSEFVQVELPAHQRAGLLTQASLMTSLSRTDSTSVVARGLFINGPLLCFPRIPSPPEDAIAEIEAQLEHDMTERERAEHRANTMPCSNCHSQFDAFGLLFEHYDAIGRYRTEEDGSPIDSSVDFESKVGFDGVYNNAIEFAEAVAERSELAQCVTRHLLTYATGEDQLKRDDCEIQNATSHLTSTSTMRDIVLASIRAPMFSQRVETETP